jgi:hypothetical protein
MREKVIDIPDYENRRAEVVKQLTRSAMTALEFMSQDLPPRWSDPAHQVHEHLLECDLRCYGTLLQGSLQEQLGLWLDQMSGHADRTVNGHVARSVKRRGFNISVSLIVEK